ncbi:hypothetical protein POL25_11405 [Nannocystis sp. bb15-2]|uniref:Uncharacterized protein n=1 Tax=Nannocystis bainbridge TaxID=2995303 RepID=A0ABT5DWM8_9BACT|nr:hypothetical protein [Nannocystis bainbridge]
MCLAGLLAGTHARASTRREVAEELVVRAGAGLDTGALHEAIALRISGVRLIVDTEGELSCGPGCTLARIERAAEEGLRISVRLGDGRVFMRTLSATAAEPERAAATSLSHLLAAIADGTAEPEPPPEPKLVAAESPAPTSTPQVCPPPPPPVVARPVAERSEPASPRFELGPTVGLVTAFGVGRPAALAGSVGNGGFVGVEMRHRNGLLVGFEARGLGARADGLRLGRVRLSVALGHSLRRGRFELRTRAAFLVEPWWVGARTEAARLQSGSPLLGAALSLTPGLSLALAPDLRVDIGLRVEAAMSVHASDGAVVQLIAPSGAPVFRLGGFELAAAAEIGVRWGQAAPSPLSRAVAWSEPARTRVFVKLATVLFSLVSIGFTILCTQSPERFLRKRTQWLKWEARRRSGTFGGMSLWWAELDADDPLPEPEWAERVIAVIHANGRLSDDTYDEFDSWTEALADATHGAVYSHPTGSFTHIWADADPKRTATRTRELLDVGDFAGLAAWIRELVAAQRRAVNAAGSQLHWIGRLRFR